MYRPLRINYPDRVNALIGQTRLRRVFAPQARGRGLPVPRHKGGRRITAPSAHPT
jgi:hypothetical protein